MFRVIAHRFGDPADVLVCEPAARPLAPPDGVVARLLASPINPSDLVTISGAYPHRTSLPFIPGFEALGVVEQAGEATTLSVGQRVLMIGSAGGWQTFKATSDDWCIPVPDDLTDDQAATAYINPLTARMMLSSAAVSAGAVVGVNAANSATGRMLLRMARGAGLRTVAVVRSRQAEMSLAGEPADDVRLDGETLPRLDAAFDAVGGASGVALALAVRPGGAFIHYGLLSGAPLPADLGSRIDGDLRLFWLRSWVHSAPRAVLLKAMDQAFEDVRRGLAETRVEARYPLDQFQDALAHQARPGRRGKILLEPQALRPAVPAS
ncbi:zinc-dependent alcohol dehydrogenase family protein [Phenylobacterium sp. LjRoot164]|uniref:zinc-dependent alcohol dehydrogenase family protein n=1 Tax=unclassified Phenylobacterium TaxID=2640670 RepID=UPI003ECC542F